LSKALLVALLTGTLLAIVDYVLATNLYLTPLYRLPALTIVFSLSYLTASRELSVFTEDDFELLENALPQAVMPLLDVVERLSVRGRAGPKRVII
jgi:hypothetical protein